MTAGWVAFIVLASYLAGIGTALWWGHCFIEKRKREGKGSLPY